MEMLNTLSPKECSIYLSKASSNLIKFLSELSYNVVLGNLDLSYSLLLSLKPYRKFIEELAQKKISLKRRRQILSKLNLYKNVFGQLIDSLIDLTSSSEHHHHHHDRAISENVIGEASDLRGHESTVKSTSDRSG